MREQNGEDLNNRPPRQSGIELLKILAVFAIVLSHTVQTLGTPSVCLGEQNCLLDYTRPTDQWQILLLAVLRYGGTFGNMVFFTCSAWFLLDSKRRDMKKWFFLLVEAWLVSVVLLLVVLIQRRGQIDRYLFISSMAPTLFANHWYLTCYLLFYLIHPYLNLVIGAMDHRTLMRSSAAMIIIYFGLLFLKSNLLLGEHPLITWTAEYFLIAYLKRYCPAAMDNLRGNLVGFAAALLCFLGSILCLNSVLPEKEGQLLRFCTGSNPFLLIMVVSLFNIARSVKLRSKAINTIASLSLLIYILHENVFMAAYYRPAFIHAICGQFGYDHILLTMLGAAVVIYLSSAACAWLIQRFLNRYVRRFTDRMYLRIRCLAEKLEDRIMAIR